MLTIALHEVHRGSVMHAEGSNDRLNVCTTLENFRMHTKHMMIKQALNKMNNVMSDNIKI